MKILLIQPPKSPRTIGGEDVFIYEPLALEYVASGVTNDHDVKILDMRLESDLESALTGFDPDIVGITAYTVHVNVAKGLFEQVKAWNPKALTVVGGHHATVMPRDFLMPCIDLVVIGEGVFSFKEIVRRFEKGESFEGIPGTLYAKGNNPSRTECETGIDLDSVPFPERTLTAKYRSRYYSEWMKPLASLRTSKGCPYHCSFCAQWKIAGGRYYKRESQRVVEELAGIQEECVFFADDESLIDAPRMALLANLIKEAGIRKRYFLYGRSDTIARHPELLKLWRGIGLERVFVGLEFFRNEDLDYICKSSTSEDNENAVRILQDLGIDIYASFIVRPSFTKQDFALLRQYCRRLTLNYASFAVLTPLPGTDLYRDVKNQLLTHNYDYFDFIHTLLPTALPLKEFYAEYRRLYMKAIPITRQLSFLKKFSLREIPGAIVKGTRFYERLKTTHLDYFQ
ncbi:MAG: radical SAM protein [bacterium]